MRRMKNILPKLVRSDQTGFVKGRYIGQNIRLLNDIYSLRLRKCGVRGYMHELFVSKTRTSEVRASEGF